MQMTGTAMLGRLMTAVGIGLGVVAIWVAYAPGTKYSDDGTQLVWLLALAIIAGLLLLWAWSNGRRDLDVLAGAVGAIMFGTYLVVPVFTAFDHWHLLDAGAWLGVCSGLVVLGTLLTTWAPIAKTGGTPNQMGMLLAFVGLVLVFVGIFPKVDAGHGSYWNLTGFGHSAGIFLIILCALGVLMLGMAWMGWGVGDWTLLLMAITFGFTMAVIVGEAFNNLGQVKAGGWLAAAGGLLAFLGAWAMRQMAAVRTEAPATSAVPPPA